VRHVLRWIAADAVEIVAAVVVAEAAADAEAAAVMVATVAVAAADTKLAHQTERPAAKAAGFFFGLP